MTQRENSKDLGSCTPLTRTVSRVIFRAGTSSQIKTKQTRFTPRKRKARGRPLDRHLTNLSGAARNAISDAGTRQKIGDQILHGQYEC